MHIDEIPFIYFNEMAKAYYNADLDRLVEIVTSMYGVDASLPSDWQDLIQGIETSGVFFVSGDVFWTIGRAPAIDKPFRLAIPARLLNKKDPVQFSGKNGLYLFSKDNPPELLTKRQST